MSAPSHASPSSERSSESSRATRTFVFAGGGSGGHISPGLAIAERLLESCREARAIFVCSTRSIDQTMLVDASARFEALPAAPFTLRPIGLVRFVRAFRRCEQMAGALLERERVEGVISLGGFVSAPVASAAGRRNIPITLVNLDAHPGRANRWLAKKSSTVLSAVPTPEDRSFSARIERIVGMPLRRIAMSPASPEHCRQRLGLDPNLKTLLVTGASQGAMSLNRFVVALAARDPGSLRGWQVLHLSGPDEVEPVSAGYRAAGVRALVLPFLHRMGLAWGAADLAVSRAGASSVAEAAANAVPSLFLPYPYHRDLHQRLNAEPIVALGGARLALDQIDPQLNVRAIGPQLIELLTDDPLRASLKAALRAHPPIDAAADIARSLLER